MQKVKNISKKRAFKLGHLENKAYKNTKGHLSFNSTFFEIEKNCQKIPLTITKVICIIEIRFRITNFKI